MWWQQSAKLAYKHQSCNCADPISEPAGGEKCSGWGLGDCWSQSGARCTLGRGAYGRAAYIGPQPSAGSEPQKETPIDVACIQSTAFDFCQI